MSVDVASNLIEVKKEIAKSDVQLIAVSKTKPNELILEAYETGHRAFGENKVQELVQKHEDLPKDIEWHMIGHLQRNKVKYIAPFVHLIHGVDSLRLLKEINKEAIKNNRVINCLLQIHIANESTKFGFSEKEVLELLNSPEYEALQAINIVGLMGMATNTIDKNTVAKEFKSLKDLFEQLKSAHFSMTPSFKEISMGMSGDYPIAIEQGSTMIRVGSTIFGARNYSK